MSDARKPSVLLVDGYSLIFRAFHALPLMVTKDGTYIFLRLRIPRREIR